MKESVSEQCIAQLEGYQVQSHIDRKLLLGVLDKKVKKLKYGSNLNDHNYYPENSVEYCMPVEAKTRMNPEKINNMLATNHSRNESIEISTQGKFRSFSSTKTD